MMRTKEDERLDTDAMTDIFHYVVQSNCRVTVQGIRGMFLARRNYLTIDEADHRVCLGNIANGWPTLYLITGMWNEVLQANHVPPSSPLYLNAAPDIIKTTHRPTEERIQRLEVRTTALEERMSATADTVARLADKVEVLTDTAERTANTLAAVSGDVQRMADSMAVLVAELKTSHNATA